MSVAYVSTEEEAYALLEELLSGNDKNLPHVRDLKIGDWAGAKIYMPNVPVSSSITAPMMAACQKYQDAIYKIIADAKYQTTDIRYLHDREKTAFQISFIVGPGSTTIDDNLKDLLNNIVPEMIKQMDGDQILILVLGLALIFGGTCAFKVWIANKREMQKDALKGSQHQKQLETFEKLSKEETRRSEILAQAIQQSRVLRDSDELAAQVREEYVKAIEATEDTQIQGVMISREQAHSLRATPRRKAETDMMEGVYRVLMIDTSDPEVTHVKIEHVETEQKIAAEFADGILDQAGLDLLTYAAAHRSNVWVKLKVSCMQGIIKKASIGEVHEAEYGGDT